MMKNIMKYFLPLAFVAVLFSACEDDLELTPYDALDENEALTTYNGLKLSVTGVYDAIQDDESYGQDYVQVNEILTDDITFDGSFTSYREIADKDALTNNVEATGLWIRAYDGINLANKILFAMDNYEIDDPAYDRNKEKMRGEVLFIRGILHWQAVSFFAQPPGYTSDNSHPGVPIMTDATMVPEDAEYNPERASVADVYAQIVDDLTTAAELLPENPEDNPKRAVSGSAYGFLSKVYLLLGDDQAAANAANEVLTSGFYNLNTSPVDNFNLKNSPETVFEIQMTESDNLSNDNDALANYWTAAERDEIHVPVDVINRYSDDDVRKTDFFDYREIEQEDGTIDTLWYSMKWTDIYENVPVLRLPEIMLNRAEALANLNGVDADAVDLVNQIRERSGLDDIDPANAEELMEAIKHERKLELVHEGIRVNDLRRWRAEEIGNSNATNQFTVPWNADNMILPIPQREMDVNDNLSQNPGY
ncbi:MAG: RagB/SusD family nutrient uptake outer membrane protein [Bacteroidota bacterium]